MSLYLVCKRNKSPSRIADMVIPNKSSLTLLDPISRCHFKFQRMDVLTYQYRSSLTRAPQESKVPKQCKRIADNRSSRRIRTPPVGPHSRLQHTLALGAYRSRIPLYAWYVDQSIMLGSLLDATLHWLADRRERKHAELHKQSEKEKNRIFES